MFYEHNSQLPRSVQYTNGYKNSAQAKYEMAVFNRPRSMNQYSNKALRISGQTILEFSLYPSLLYELRDKIKETRKPRSHFRI